MPVVTYFPAWRSLRVVRASLAMVIFFSMLAFVPSPIALAQQPEMITDRPDQSDSPFLVPCKMAQVETGMLVEKNRDPVDAIHVAYNTTLVRYGLCSFLELRSTADYLGHYATWPEAGKVHAIGLAPVSLGFKSKLADEKNLRPQIALQVHYYFNCGSRAFRSFYPLANARLVFSHTIDKRWSIAYNVGTEWLRDQAGAVFLYTFTGTYAASEVITVYAECYGIVQNGHRPENLVDGGLLFTLTPSLQLDLAGGAGLDKNAIDYFVSAGCSFRLPN